MLTKKGLIILLSAIVIGIALSCDEPEVRQFPETFYRTHLIQTGPARVLTSDGEVRDPTLRQAFITNDTVYIRSRTGAFFAEESDDTIWFINEGMAKARLNWSLRTYAVSRDGSNDVLTRTDTTTGGSYYNEKSRSLSYYLGTVKPEIYYEYLISSTAGLYYFGFKGRENLVLRRFGNMLVMPYVVYTFRQIADPRVFPNPGYINNILDENFYKNLKGEEIVTLAEYWVMFEKVK